MHDIIVIGAGPAGMTAALYALRADKSVLLLEKENFGGQITYSSRLENYPSIIEISGSAFAEKMLEQVMTHGADIELAEAKEIKDMGEYKVVCTEYGDFEGKDVIIATGSKHRHLGLEGEEELIGSGISFCAVCDGSFYTDKSVAVIGGGNTALQEAVMLSDICKKVTIIQNLSFMTGEKKLLAILEQKDNVEMIFDTVVTSFKSNNGELCGIGIKNIALNEENEIDFDKDVIEKIRQARFNGFTHYMIVVAEGAGSAADIAKQIKETIDLDPRVTVLGHIQRGGVPTGRDRVNATKMGYLAVELLLRGKNNRIVCTNQGHFTDIDIDEGLSMQKSIQKMEVDVLAAMTGL